MKMLASNINKRICELMDLKQTVYEVYIRHMNRELSLNEYLKSEQDFETRIKQIDSEIDSLCKIYFQI